MITIKRPFYAIIILALFMTACSSKGKSSSGTNAAAAQTASNANQSQQTSAAAPANTNLQNAAAGKAAIDLSKIGTPIRASQMIISNGIIYYNSPVSSKICSVDENQAVQYSSKDTKPSTNNLAVTQLGNESASEILFFNNTIYYSNKADGNKLYSIGADGKNKKMLVNQSSYNLEMLGTYIYYINGDNNLCIFDISDGGNYSLGLRTRCFDSDGANIYYQAMNPDMNHTLNSIKPDGTGDTILNSDSPTSLVVQDGKIFYGNGRESQTLYSTTLDGSNTIKFSGAGTTNMQYDNGWIYYMNTTDFGNIYKVQPDGSQNTKVISDPFIKSFIVNGGTVYFTRSIDSKDIVYKTAG